MKSSSGDDHGQSGGPSRRALLLAGLAGTAGIAALPATELVRDLAAADGDTDPGPAAREYAFNQGWLFHEYAQGSYLADYDDSRFTPVTVPHCVTELSWRDWNPLSWERTWVYRKHFDAAGLLDGRVLLDFDGVMVNAAVMINGQLAGSHQGGYLPWSTELTSYLRPGGNLLAVIVDSRCLSVPPEGVPGHPGSIDFLQPGGIYRDVRLRVLPETFLSDVFAQPGDVLTAQPRVDVQCTIDAATAPAGPVQLTAVLSDHDRRVAAVSRTLAGVPAGTSVAGLRLSGLRGIELWSPGNPRLYELTTTLSVRGAGTHTMRKRIGFRQAEFRPDGFFLNGERLKIFGLNRHQLYPYTGMAMPARVQRRDAEILRNDFNCNMVRCSHYPQSPHFLDACDELGLMVWEEAPGWHDIGGAAWQDMVVRNVRDMVVRDRSRPSVVVWGTRLNETVGHAGLWRRTRQAARELDGSRPSTGAMDRHGLRQWDEDVFAFNDYHLADGRARLLPPLPRVPYLVSESVGVMRITPRHYRWTDPPTELGRQAVLHAQVHDIAQSDPRYAGLLAWAAFDYASLLGPGGQRVKWAGVADGFRVAKPGAAIYLSQVDPQVRPVIVPVFFWDFEGGATPAGPGPDTMIATNCEQVEVFVGGEHAGTGTPMLASEMYGHLAYPPTLVDLTVARNSHPELRIEGYVGGQQVAVARMTADPAGDHLAMTVDDTMITGDGSDATRIVFRAVDAYGNQRRYGTGEVTLRADGPVDLIGDNPFEFGAYGGLGAVWARSRPGTTGPVTVTAEHRLLGRARVEFGVRSAGRTRTA